MNLNKEDKEDEGVVKGLKQVEQTDNKKIQKGRECWSKREWMCQISANMYVYCCVLVVCLKRNSGGDVMKQVRVTGKWGGSFYFFTLLFQAVLTVC